MLLGRNLEDVGYTATVGDDDDDDDDDGDEDEDDDDENCGGENIMIIFKQ